MREWLGHLLGMCKRKNDAYAETDVTADALNNFREAASEYGVSMMTYAMIMQGKHERGWKSFTRTGKAPNKPWRVLGDRLVYCLLQYCIAVDQGMWTHEEAIGDDD